MTHWVETCGTLKQNIVFVINMDVLDCIIFIDIILQYLSAGAEESHATVRTARIRLRYKPATTETQVQVLFLGPTCLILDTVSYVHT